jgi:hypothetical protein
MTVKPYLFKATIDFKEPLPINCKESVVYPVGSFGTYLTLLELDFITMHKLATIKSLSGSIPYKETIK